ncbi:MAG: DinB family protein [Gemmatimonadaceae bacterium]|nr:DinB family protein [Gemmatimonadaceae bacterium]MCW5826329.1 DinB family protein [Gemmatimonadaceae bacterium]
MSLAAQLVQELEQEAAVTRRVLERVPKDKFDWAPAPKTRTLGQLAMHIATNPGSTMALAAANPSHMPEMTDATPHSRAQLLAALDESVLAAKTLLAPMTDAQVTERWTVLAGGKEVLAMPRNAFLRAVFLNHWYHHRGQLTTYLRLLGETVPAIYGPSADENPFA